MVKLICIVVSYDSPSHTFLLRLRRVCLPSLGFSDIRLTNCITYEVLRLRGFENHWWHTLVEKISIERRGIEVSVVNTLPRFESRFSQVHVNHYVTNGQDMKFLAVRVTSRISPKSCFVSNITCVHVNKRICSCREYSLQKQTFTGWRPRTEKNEFKNQNPSELNLTQSIFLHQAKKSYLSMSSQETL